MIRIVQGELADSTAEAVLRPVSAEWVSVTPAMRRLEMAAGEEPIEQARRLGELPVGSAVITAAGNLSAQFLIHVIVRSMDEPVTEAGVRRGLLNGLRRVSEWGIRSVAMPPMGTGAGNLDPEHSAVIMAELLTGHDASLDFEIRVDSDYEHDVFQRQFRG